MKTINEMLKNIPVFIRITVIMILISCLTGCEQDAVRKQVATKMEQTVKEGIESNNKAAEVPEAVSSALRICPRSRTNSVLI